MLAGGGSESKSYINDVIHCSLHSLSLDILPFPASRSYILIYCLCLSPVFCSSAPFQPLFPSGTLHAAWVLSVIY